jgi:CubicO group peptidase (beta-lactamase class C family)
VTVIPAPVVDQFSVGPAAILPDESATLTWSVRETSQISIDQGIGSVPANGSRSVSPSATTTYRLTATGPGGETTASSALKVVVYDWTALAAALDAAVGSGDGQVPGYSFALEIAGRTVFRRGGGNLGVNTTVPIASASKAASAAAILTLADAGLIKLDEPVSTYLGDSIDWPIEKAPITMRMLLNHTSGLPFDSPCLADNSITLQACAQEIANRPLTTIRPDLAFIYSGAGYQLAGYVAQQAAGMPWTELFEQNIGEPLGLSTFRYVGDQNPRIGGGALSNTLDYLKLMRMFLDGGSADGQQVLSSASAASVKADQISPLLMLSKPVDGSFDGYSNGWWLSAADAHPGSAGPEVSDPGLFGATPWMDFDKNYSAALWVVKDTTTGVDLWRQLRPLILQQIESQGQLE